MVGKSVFRSSSEPGREKEWRMKGGHEVKVETGKER